METKDQANQNPEEELTQSQGENSQSVEKADTNEPNENQKAVVKLDAKPVDAEKKEQEAPKAELKKEKNTDVESDIDSKNLVEKTEAEKDISKKKDSKDAKLKAKIKEDSKLKKVTSEVETDLQKETVKEEIPEKTEGKSEMQTKMEEQPDVPKSSDKLLADSIIEDKNKKIIIDEKAESLKKDTSEPQEEEDEDHEDLEEEHHDVETIEIESEIEYNSLSRDQLVEMLEVAVNEGEVQDIKRKVSQIKVNFLRLNKQELEKKLENLTEAKDGETAAQKEPYIDPIEVRFNEAFNIYRRKRKEYLAHLEKVKLENLEAKKVILEELKSLIDSEESLRKTYDEFKLLQESWKEIGMVPKADVNNLWQSYHFFVEKFFDKVKINRELRDLDMKKNLEAKIALCEKSEELLLEKSIVKSFKELQKLHEKWREIGSIPQDKKDELWERFKSTTDKINQRRHEYYIEFQEEQKKNLLAKTALCEKAEELVSRENDSFKVWQSNTAEITELLKIWKTLGSAPRKHNDEIWERFKSSLDSFFTAKKEYFQKIKEEQQNNYNLKLDLCVQAEALKSSENWRNTTGDLINLQKEWKSIGPVPRKHSDKIWKRFRAACDEFFNNKSAFYANIGKHETENQKLKEELIEKVKSFEFKEDDKNKNLELLKEFQREWTNIGHVPIKEKNRLQGDFRAVVNKRLDELKISHTEMQSASYKQRMEGLKDKPDAKRILYNERVYLSNKKKKLEEEIGLWENNLGFFAESKKANLLKEEFEKKINKAKGELELLKAKIKFVNQQGD